MSERKIQQDIKQSEDARRLRSFAEASAESRLKIEKVARIIQEWRGIPLTWLELVAAMEATDDPHP